MPAEELALFTEGGTLDPLVSHYQKLIEGASRIVVIAPIWWSELPAIIKAAWPLLHQHGTLVLVNSLLDGTLADASRTDRDTAAAREADEYLRELEGASVTRLPLGSGLTLVTKL